MPFNAVSGKDFKNREGELDFLRRLAGFGDGAVTQNVLLEGARGVGKTELLKQFYRAVFWEEKDVIPFYYCFRRATLKGAHFARDYFTRFVRQLLACVEKDPSFIDSMGTPLGRLKPLASGRALAFLPELIEDFNEQVLEEGLPAQVFAALSAPLIAADRYGKRLIIMLDDFHLAPGLYEREPGDTPGAVSLFESSMRAHRCPHILTGSPEDALENLFVDDSFRGKAERLFVRALPEDAAFSLFREACGRSGITAGDDCMEPVRRLCGNPLYIRNMARALWKMQRKEATPKSFQECYAYEVSEGETAFYWSSVLKGGLREAHMKRLALELMMRAVEAPYEVRDFQRLARMFSAPEASVRAALDGLNAAGMVRVTGSVTPCGDTVLEDFIRSAYMLEVEGAEPEKVRETVIRRRFGPAAAPAASFEMVIPMASEAELVAAKAVEQIAASINISKEEIEGLQLALIEACINAFEHSGSYEKKVFLKCSVHPGGLEVAVESSGRGFDPETARRPGPETPADGQKRGLGLKLMEKYMDEVKVERIGDRTRVVLTKNIRPAKGTK